VHHLRGMVRRGEVLCGRKGKEMKDKPSDADPLEVTLLLIGLAVVVLLWPALAFHGRTDAGAWHWTAACTIACSVWWAFLLTVIGGWILAKANSPQVRALEKGQRPQVPQRPWTPRVPHPLRPDLRRLYATRFLEP
jgi:hypothetical protein